MRLPQRAIHLDFHTMPAMGDVGANFDAEEFAQNRRRIGSFSFGFFEGVPVSPIYHH